MTALAVDQFNKRITLVFHDHEGNATAPPGGATPRWTTSDPTILRFQSDPESPWSVQLLPVAEGVATIAVDVTDGLGNAWRNPEGEVVTIDPVHIEVGPGAADAATIAVSDDPPEATPIPQASSDPNAPGAPLPAPDRPQAPETGGGTALQAAVSGAPGTGKTLYQRTGNVTVDPSTWEIASVQTPDFQPLYTFTGDSNPGDANGSSPDWGIYNGPTIPVGPLPVAPDPNAGAAPTPPASQTLPAEVVSPSPTPGVPPAVDPNASTTPDNLTPGTLPDAAPAPAPTPPPEQTSPDVTTATPAATTPAPDAASAPAPAPATAPETSTPAAPETSAPASATPPTPAPTPDATAAPPPPSDAGTASAPPAT